MPIDPILGAGIAQAAGSVLGNLLGFGSQQATNKANMKLAQYQWEKNFDMWNMQNQYNSPFAQMQRLKDAGLNPNMVYGNGSAANQAGSAPSYQAPKLQAYTDFSGVANGFQSIINSQLTSQQIKNLENQNKNLETDNLAKQLQIARDSIKYAAENQDYYFERQMKRYQTRLTDLAVVQAEQDFDRGQLEYEIRQIDKNMSWIRQDITQKEYERIVQQVRTETANADIREHERRDYEELGIRPSDPYWSRAIANVLLDVVGKDRAKKLLNKILGL